MSKFFIDESLPTKLVKHAVILKSGIYKYARNELPESLGEIPEKHKNRTIFSVYRPPEAVKDAHDKGIFTRMPLTVGHPGEDVTPENFKDHAVGLTGDETTYNFNDGVATLGTSLTIIDKSGMQSYNDGIREVSPGYDGVSVWEDGVDPSGEPYQILLKEFVNPNHLAIVGMARGGKKVRILDGGDKVEKLRMADIVQAVGKIFGVKAKYLDGMEEGDYSDEDKEYMLKELHKLLQHASKGKIHEYRPEGFGKGRTESKEAGDGKDGKDLKDGESPDGEAGADDPVPVVDGKDGKKEPDKKEPETEDGKDGEGAVAGEKEPAKEEEDEGGKKPEGDGEEGSKPTFHDSGKHITVGPAAFKDGQDIDYDALIRNSTLSKH